MATECIKWHRSINPITGYGRLEVKVGSKINYPTSHRHLYEQKYGKLPKWLVLDHLCRNRWCVNLDHLEPVTYAENIRRGNNAKINMTQANEIRERYSKKEFNQSQLSKIYKIGQDQISRIVNNLRWAK